MKKIKFVCLVFLLISCTMSNKEREKFPPAEYFSGQELTVAEAIYYGDQKQLGRLLDRGYATDHIGQGGLTYLMYAVFIENYEMTEFLLKKGAGPNKLSPWMLHKRNVVREKKDWRPANMLPLETCCGADYPIKWVKLLIKYKADLNDNRAEPPLHAAIMSDDIEKVKYLLDCGADINQEDRSSTPIMTAAKILSWHMVDYLLDRGADVFRVNRNGYTLGLYLQEYINRDAWTPEGRKRIEGLIHRLKEKGVQFPVMRQPSTPIDPVSKAESPSPKVSSSPSAGFSPKTPPTKPPHSWILDDDDDNWIIS